MQSVATHDTLHTLPLKTEMCLFVNIVIILELIQKLCKKNSSQWCILWQEYDKRILKTCCVNIINVHFEQQQPMV